MLKIIIVLLLAGVIASLSSGLFFLFKDTEQPGSKRTWLALGVRIILASLLLGTIYYGLATGQLRMGANAPWHDPTGATTAP
ncbi:MAG TPA: DUF2909 domain-containing protein [Gammaproteobacteria bacterium]|nr:DUF2909 domain-containing protein [Gammaproteobacteria bacterium]